MLVAVALDGEDGWLCPLGDDGTSAGEAVRAADLPAAVAARERARAALGVASTAALYPRLLRAGVRVGRCHDLGLTQALLNGHDGRWGAAAQRRRPDRTPAGRAPA